MLGLPSAPGMSRGQRRCAAVPSCPSGLTLPLALGSARRLCPYRLQQRRSPSDPLPVGSANGGPRGACRDGEREVGCLMPCLSVFRGPSGHGPARWSPPQHPRTPSPFSRSVNSPGALHWGLGVPYILHRPLDSTPFKSLTSSSPPASRQPLPPADTCGGRPGTPLPPPQAETAVHVCPGGPRTRLREGTHREAIHAAEQKQGLPPEPSSEARGLLFQLYFIFS